MLSYKKLHYILQMRHKKCNKPAILPKYNQLTQTKVARAAAVKSV